MKARFATWVFAVLSIAFIWRLGGTDSGWWKVFDFIMFNLCMMLTLGFWRQRFEQHS